MVGATASGTLVVGVKAATARFFPVLSAFGSFPLRLWRLGRVIVKGIEEEGLPMVDMPERFSSINGLPHPPRYPLGGGRNGGCPWNAFRMVLKLLDRGMLLGCDPSIGDVIVRGL